MFQERSNASRSEQEALMRMRIASYSDTLLRKESWFQKANELIEAMSLLEPRIEEHWQYLRKQLDDPNAEAEPEHSLMNVHMLLAGFAIENLCKGHLVDQLASEERENVKAGELPESLKGNHAILIFVEQTGMKLSDPEKYLLKRIGEAVVWRGRYPVPTSHKRTGPFAQIGSDVKHIKTLLQRLRKHVGAKSSYRA
jgi:hypothetical protein